jgi:hypothetical protein
VRQPRPRVKLARSWLDHLPPIVARIVQVMGRGRYGIKRTHKTGTVTRTHTARTYFARILRGSRPAYDVQVNKRGRVVEGKFERCLEAAITWGGKTPFAIDFSPHWPEHESLARLANTPGLKVLVLLHSTQYFPLEDPRMGRNIPAQAALDQIDFIVNCRGWPSIVQTPEQIKALRIPPAYEMGAVLEIIDQAWVAHYPLSVWDNCYEYAGERFAARVLVARGFHPESVKHAIAEVRGLGLARPAQSRYNWIRGLKLTDAGRIQLDLWHHAQASNAATLVE